MNKPMKHPNPLMLLRIAQADATGMAVEFTPSRLNEALLFDRYVGHPELLIPAGNYTDDTQMSIAVAEALIARPNPSTLHFAERFASCYRRDPRPGYSKRVERLLIEHVPTGVLTRAASMLVGEDINSDFNGAAMRSVPIGVLPSPENILHVAAKQAILTHDTPGGVLSSQIVALASHFALYHDAPFDELPEFLRGYLGWRTVDRHSLGALAWAGPVAPNRGGVVGGMGMLTVQAVLTLLAHRTSLMDMMRTLLCWGGDTDSVAAIAWGIASARYSDELPPYMERDLDMARPNRGTFGAPLLRELGRRLMIRYGGNSDGAE